MERKVSDVERLRVRLREHVKRRQAMLDERHGMQRFENSALDLAQVVDKIGKLWENKDMRLRI